MKRSLNNDPRPVAVVLLSGGIDSAVALAESIAEGYRCLCLAVSYGQRHGDFELTSSRKISGHYHCVFREAFLNMRALTNNPAPLIGGAVVPVGRTLAEMASGVSPTYVPGRNTVLLSLALSMAESEGAVRVVMGANADDAAGYPDCRPEYIAAMNVASRLVGGVEIHAPHLARSKADVVRVGLALGVPLERTWSCYAPNTYGGACGGCDACVLRASAFAACGVTT